MLLERPILQPLAAEAIKDLDRDGIRVAPQDALWLQHLAAKCVRPTPGDEVLYLDPPVHCGNALLWPLSIGARLWLERYGRPWFAGQGWMETLAVGYAMAHSRRPTVFRALTSQVRAAWRIARWATRLDATRAELAAAIAAARSNDDIEFLEVLTPADKLRKPRPIAADYGDVLALLIHNYGQSPAYWLWQVSEEYAAELLARINLTTPPERRVDAGSAKFRALSIFNLAVSDIRRRAREAAAQAKSAEPASDSTAPTPPAPIGEPDHA